MKHWGRRIRGAIGMGLTFAVAGIVAGGVLARVPGFDADVPFPLLFAQFGFVAGIVFSGILVSLEGRRQLDRMSLSRFAGWGAVSGLLLSGIFVGAAALRGGNTWGEFLLFGPPLVIGSAVCAAASLTMARRAARRELAATNAMPADELIADEEPELLGRGD